jgi:hypothetical protein
VLITLDSKSPAVRGETAMGWSLGYSARLTHQIYKPNPDSVRRRGSSKANHGREKSGESYAADQAPFRASQQPVGSPWFQSLTTSSRSGRFLPNLACAMLRTPKTIQASASIRGI